MLYRLIYCSQTSAPMSPQDVQLLLDKARRSNRLHDISGMLVFDSQYFLQAIEGNRQALSNLYGNLVRDKRHQRLLLLGFEPIERRSFSDWTMGFAAADASRRRLYLRHGPTGRFEPHALHAAGALALLGELAQEAEREAEAEPLNAVPA